MSDELVAAQKKLTDRVMGRPGVSGTAIGQDGGGACLKVYVSADVDRGALPKSVDGVPVVVEESGTFRRL